MLGINSSAIKACIGDGSSLRESIISEIGEGNIASREEAVDIILKAFPIILGKIFDELDVSDQTLKEKISQLSGEFSQGGR